MSEQASRRQGAGAEEARPEGVSPVIEVRDFAKVFRDFWRRPRVTAVDGISMSILPGEIFGLLGPNGSGKSTTMKTLMGLLRPTSGSIHVLGRSPRDILSKREIGYMPEESYLYRHLTARETLDFYGRLFGLDRATRRERVAELLELTELTQAADRRVGEFSKGMARRVGFAQALINNPRLIFLDEPTAGLDPIGCSRVKKLLINLRDNGKTILLSSHLLADVEDLCDRIAVLHKGRIIARGRVGDLLKKTDKVRVTFSAPPAGRLAEVVASIRSSVGDCPEMDHPAIDLERFFLDVISGVQDETVGADAGVRLPLFLKYGGRSS